MAVADPSPTSEVKTTDPHDAQPTPNKLAVTPASETPISFWILIDFLRKYINKLVCTPISIALVTVTDLDNGVKLVCKDPKSPVSKLVFCHRVIVELVIVLVIKCKLGSQAEKAKTIKLTKKVNAKYFGDNIIFTTLAIITGAKGQLLPEKPQRAELQ